MGCNSRERKKRSVYYLGPAGGDTDRLAGKRRGGGEFQRENLIKAILPTQKCRPNCAKKNREERKTRAVFHPLRKKRIGYADIGISRTI